MQATIKTVGDLQMAMAGYRDAGMAMKIQIAIRDLVEKKEMSQDDELSLKTIEKIEQRIKTNDVRADQLEIRFAASTSNTMDPAYEAIKLLKSLIKDTGQ